MLKKHLRPRELVETKEGAGSVLRTKKIQQTIIGHAPMNHRNTWTWAGRTLVK